MLNVSHLSFKELEAGLDEIRQSPKDNGVLKMIVRRPSVDEREELKEGELSLEDGLVGDTWKERFSRRTPDGAANLDAQITIMNARAAALLAQSEERWSLAGDQLFVDMELSDENIPAGTQLSIGSAVVEVSAVPHTGCEKFAARYGTDATKFVNSKEGKRLHLRGINTRVVQAGTVRVGNVVKKVKRSPHMVMDTPLRPNHKVFVDKFVQDCQADERIVAAFLLGSYVNGHPDEHSDLDLCLITTNDSYDDFAAQRGLFVLRLGEPLFMEDFDIPGILFLIFPDGSEVELNYARESELGHLLTERYTILLDKKNITGELSIHEPAVDMDRQTKRLRRFTYGFWHDFSHFTTAMARGQLWWAQGQLEFLRTICVGLARLRNNFSDTEVEGEVYFKIEKAMPVDVLAPLRETLCPMERESMLRAGSLLAKYFKEVAEPLASEHGIRYPTELEALMLKHLQHLQ